MFSRIYPQLKGHVTNIDTSTPLSIEHYLATKNGSSIGLDIVTIFEEAKLIKIFLFFAKRFQTSLFSLFFMILFEVPKRFSDWENVQQHLNIKTKVMVVIIVFFFHVLNSPSNIN